MDKISIPPEALGFLVGKRGARIQDLEKRAGARMSVSFENATVTVVGSPTARAAAAKLVEGTIQRYLSPVMNKVSRLVVLGNSFREKSVTGVQFERYGGPLDYFNAGKTVFRLHESTYTEPETVEPEFDIEIDLTAMSESPRLEDPIDLTAMVESPRIEDSIDLTAMSESPRLADSIDLTAMSDSPSIADPTEKVESDSSDLLKLMTELLTLSESTAEGGNHLEGTVEIADTATTVVKSLAIKERTTVEAPSKEISSTAVKKTGSLAASRRDRAKMIRNTGNEEVVHFLADEVMDYTNEGGKDSDRVTIRVNFGYKLFHSTNGERFNVQGPRSFETLPKVNIGSGSNISSFFLPQITLGKLEAIQNHAIRLGYQSCIPGEKERIFRLNLNENKTDIIATLRVVKDRNGQEILEIVSFSNKRATLATADIPSTAEGLDKRVRFHVEGHTEPPEWFVELIQKTKVPSQGCNLELPISNETSLRITSIRRSERKLYRSKMFEESATANDIPCEDATSLGWQPSVYELAMIKTLDKDLEYFELALRLVPESIPWKIVKLQSRKKIESLVDGLLKEADRLTGVLFA